MIVFPAQGLIALTILVGIVFLLTGIAQSFYAFWVRPANGWGYHLAAQYRETATKHRKIRLDL